MLATVAHILSTIFISKFSYLFCAVGEVFLFSFFFYLCAGGFALCRPQERGRQCAKQRWFSIQ